MRFCSYYESNVYGFHPCNKVNVNTVDTTNT